MAFKDILTVPVQHNSQSMDNDSYFMPDKASDQTIKGVQRLIDDQSITIDCKSQTLTFLCGGIVRSIYSISTSKYGLGETINSFKTPRGEHSILQKIGCNKPLGAIFKARVYTEQVWSDSYAESNCEDSILTRILWLSGCEAGNRFFPKKTRKRYIYLHGVPDFVKLGEASSIGCIRMRNTDIVSLYDMVREGCKVFIE